MSDTMSREDAERKVREMAAAYFGIKGREAEHKALTSVLTSLDDLRAMRAELDDLRPGDDCPVCGADVC